MQTQYKGLTPSTVAGMVALLNVMEKYQSQVVTIASKTSDKELKENVYAVLLSYKQFMDKVKTELKPNKSIK